jgi:hypothetical protein
MLLIVSPSLYFICMIILDYIFCKADFIFCTLLLHLLTAGFVADPPVAPILQPMPCTLTVPDKISGISSVTNSSQ